MIIEFVGSVIVLLASLKAIAFGASHLAVLAHGGLRSNFA